MLPSFDTKLGCVFPMVISSDFRMGKHRDDDHEEDAPYFRIIDRMTTFLYLGQMMAKWFLASG